MRACFPVAHDRGLESRVYPHFGSAPMFLIVDIESKATRTVANPECEHAHGRCHPFDVLADEKIDAVVVSGIGPGALDRLREARIAVYHTSRGTVSEALDAIARGALPPVLAEDALVRGFGRGHGHHRERHRGAGHGPYRHRRGRA
jgi:predicted Fe-Mo cluster-binding NifX family protein